MWNALRKSVNYINHGIRRLAACMFRLNSVCDLSIFQANSSLKMNKLVGIVLGVLLVASVVSSGWAAMRKIETGRYFHLRSHDDMVLTVGGDNSRTVKIITEDLKGTEPRQQFWVGSGTESHYISPRAQNTFSTLVLDLDLTTSLLNQDIRRGARNQWWFINEVGEKKWSIQNVRSGQCLATNGKSTQLYGTVCDLSSANQTWIFEHPPVAIKGIN